jgi:hypothetical protein
MGRPTPQSQNKRKREQLKQDKRRAKEEKRAARKAARQTDDAGLAGNAGATPSD